MNYYCIVPARKAKGKRLKQSLFGEVVVKTTSLPPGVNVYKHEDILKILQGPEWNYTLSRWDRIMLWIGDRILP